MSSRCIKSQEANSALEVGVIPAEKEEAPRSEDVQSSFFERSARELPSGPQGCRVTRNLPSTVPPPRTHSCSGSWATASSRSKRGAVLSSSLAGREAYIPFQVDAGLQQELTSGKFPFQGVCWRHPPRPRDPKVKNAACTDSGRSPPGF